MTKVGIVGVGNLLLKDEGIGVWVIHALEGLKMEGLRLIDAGTSPDLAFLIQGLERIIVIDAARMGGEPGEIYRFGLSDLEYKPTEIFSLHEIGLIENLRIAQILGDLQEATIIGIEPAEIDLGDELSPILKEKLPQILNSVLEERDALLRAEAA